MAGRLGSAAVAVVASAWLSFLALRQGITDDDDFYVPAGVRMVDWLGTLLRYPGDALQRTAIDAAFGINHEHPPLAKLMIGLGARLGEACGLTPLVGARLGIVAMTTVMLFALLQLARSRSEGILAVIILVTMPRFGFHATVPTLDVAVAATMVVAVALWVRAARWSSRRAFVAVGAAMGMALLTKLNAPFLLVPMVLLWLVEHRRRLHIHTDGLLLPKPPAALLGALLLGPLLFVAAWPWLWSDTLSRLSAYAAFHLRHYPILMWFDGVIHDKVLAPWHAPWRMAVAVMPVTVAAVIGIGLWPTWCAAQRLWCCPNHERFERDRWLVACALQAVVAVATVSFAPGVPVYGGEKLFMPFFPFAVVVAAAGVTTMGSWAVRWRHPRLVILVVGALVCGPGVVGSWQCRGGHALSYFGALIGGTKGAIARGWEGTYYDVADRQLAEWLGAHAAGLKVHFAPNHKEYVRTYRWWQREGVASVSLVDSIAKADLVVLSEEPRWSSLGQLQTMVAGWEVAHHTIVDGVIISRVYVGPNVKPDVKTAQ